MGQYKKDNVTFSQVSQPQVVFGALLGSKQYTYDEEGNIKDNPNIGRPTSPIINAIDIDWNNAKIDGLSKTISNTSDLLNVIKEVNDNIPNSVYDLNGANALLTRYSFDGLKEELRGKSAYELAQEAYESANTTAFPYKTIDQWIASLKGDPGERGFPGTNGKDGKSAYELAQEVYESNHSDSFPYKTINDWISSLKGDKGDQGEQGIRGEKGPQGETGKSAYELAQDFYRSIETQFPYANENDFISKIISGNDTKSYTNEQIGILENRLVQSIKDNATTIEETDDNHLLVELVATEQSEGQFTPPFKYKITLKDVASQDKLDKLEKTLDNFATSDLIRTVDERIDTLIGGASEKFDTLKEIEDWIDSFEISPQKINADIEEAKQTIKDLIGNVTEEKEYKDINGNSYFVTEYKKYSTNGNQYALSIEQLNKQIDNLLGTVSTAKDVKDGAEENVIDAIAPEMQQFNDIVDHFINVTKTENSKTVFLGVNQDLLNKIQLNITNEATKNAVNASKEYVDERTSWNVI